MICFASCSLSLPSARNFIWLDTKFYSLCLFALFITRKFLVMEKVGTSHIPTVRLCYREGYHPFFMCCNDQQQNHCFKILHLRSSTRATKRECRCYSTFHRIHVIFGLLFFRLISCALPQVEKNSSHKRFIGLNVKDLYIWNWVFRRLIKYGLHETSYNVWWTPKSNLWKIWKWLKDLSIIFFEKFENFVFSWSF